MFLDRHLLGKKAFRSRQDGRFLLVRTISHGMTLRSTSTEQAEQIRPHAMDVYKAGIPTSGGANERDWTTWV
jgi:hypothetical protein